MNLRRTLTILFVAVLLLAVAGFGVRAVRAMRAAPLQPWHTHVPVELAAGELDKADWARYLAQERAIFEDIRANVTQRLEPADRVPSNRYFAGSPSTRRVQRTGTVPTSWSRPARRRRGVCCTA